VLIPPGMVHKHLLIQPTHMALDYMDMERELLLAPITLFENGMG